MSLCGIGYLVLDLSHTVSDALLVARAVYDGSVVLSNSYLVASSKHLESCLLKLQALLLADYDTAGQYGYVLEHCLAAVAEARSLDSANLQSATQTVHDERGKSLRVNILGDHEQRRVRSLRQAAGWAESP